jgi:hypothetical protein
MRILSADAKQNAGADTEDEISGDDGDDACA